MDQRKRKRQELEYDKTLRCGEAFIKSIMEPLQDFDDGNDGLYYFEAVSLLGDQ